MDSSQRIHLVISDVDGTLLNPEGELSPVNYVAVARLRQAGVKFSLSSARPSFGMHWLIRMLEIDCVCSGLNGGILFHADGKVAAEMELDRGTIEDLASRMQKHGLDVWLYTRDQWFVPRLSAPHVLHNVTHASADKGRAAVAIAITEGAQMNDVATIGDSPADTPMSQASRLSIAMGQASEDVRRMATQVTRSNADNGLAWAIEYMLRGKWFSNGAR